MQETKETQPIIMDSTLTCPECDYQETLTMPTDACLWFHECTGCHTLLKPKKGDCCVFCSYATVPCPPIQQQDSNGDTGGCCGTL